MISSVNVTKSDGNGRFGHIYWRNVNEKLDFLCSIDTLCISLEKFNNSLKFNEKAYFLQKQYYWLTLIDGKVAGKCFKRQIIETLRAASRRATQFDNTGSY